jgi:hypothetical protein
LPAGGQISAAVDTDTVHSTRHAIPELVLLHRSSRASAHCSPRIRWVESRAER